MASKRTCEATSSVPSKMIKISDNMELPDDIDISMHFINDDKTIFLNLQYDEMYDDFFVHLVKTGKSDADRRHIILSTENWTHICQHLEKIVLLLRRYHQSGKKVCFTFDVGQEVVMKLETNPSYSSLDIRKYFVKDGKTIPTKTGVRFNADNVTMLKSVVVKIFDEIEELQKRSCEIITKSRYALIEKEINLLHSLQKPFCEGCKTNHPSQTEHMHLNGCLSEDPPCWEEIVDDFFVEACEGIKHSEYEQLAEKYARKVQAPLIRAVVDDESLDDVKFFILNAKTCEDEMYKALVELS